MSEKQQKLDGIVATIKEVEDAAEALRTVRTKRMEVQKDEAAAVLVLKGALEKHDLKVYTYEIEDGAGEVVTLDALVKSTEKVYVRKHKAEGEEGEEPEEKPEE